MKINMIFTILWFFHIRYMWSGVVEMENRNSLATLSTLHEFVSSTFRRINTGFSTFSTIICISERSRDDYNDVKDLDLDQDFFGGSIKLCWFSGLSDIEYAIWASLEVTLTLRANDKTNDEMYKRIFANFRLGGYVCDAMTPMTQIKSNNLGNVQAS